MKKIRKVKLDAPIHVICGGSKWKVIQESAPCSIANGLSRQAAINLAINLSIEHKLQTVVHYESGRIDFRFLDYI